MEPTRVKPNDKMWDKIKLDVFGIYIQEDKDLKATMAAIKGGHGFSACKRNWKYKLDEWGYKKNLPIHDMQVIVAKEAKRKREGKDTTFCFGDIQISAKRMDNFKRRKTGEVDASVGTPPGITYHTPGVDRQTASPVKMHEESISYLTPLPQPSSLAVSCASSTMSFEFATETLTSEINMPGVSSISMLDRYLSDEIQPWSQYHLFHQLGDHDTVLSKQRQILARVPQLSDLPVEQNILPTLERIEDQFSLDSYYTSNKEKVDPTSEDAALEELFDLAATLAKYQNEYGEFDPLTLKQEFKIAKASGMNGYYKEAEYHCLRILDRYPQMDVLSYLGMILAQTSRLEESTLLLFSALTVFIIQFNTYSAQENARFFAPIESLYIEFIERSHHNIAALTSCLCRMMTTIQTAISEGTTSQISPQLFIYGFSLADECSNLNITDAAKYMYQHLLRKCPLHLDAVLHGTERARAHLGYATLLRQEQGWTSSAEQLLLGYESATNSKTYLPVLMIHLWNEYSKLLSHIADELNDPGSFMSRIKGVLARNRRQFCTREEASKYAQTSATRVAQYFFSDLPFHFATLIPSVDSLVFDISPSAIEPLAHVEKDDTSTTSSSESVSHKHELVTYPDSEITGISNSEFMVG